MRIAASVVVMLGGCNWILGLDHVNPPTAGDGRLIDGMPPPDALQFEDCRGQVVFTDAPLLFPGLDEVSTPTIRGDLQEVYDIENDANGTNIHHWVLGTDHLFAQVVDLAMLNSGNENDPSLTADGLEIAFVSTRQVGMSNLYLAERETVDSPWGIPVLMPGLEGYIAASVALSADGKTLYAAYGSGDLLQAERTERGIPFMPGAIVASDVVYPTVSADGLELISQSDLMPGLFEQVRDSKLTPFGNLIQVQLSGLPKQPELSRDNHVLVTATQKYYTRSCQ